MRLTESVDGRCHLVDVEWHSSLNVRCRHGIVDVVRAVGSQCICDR